MRQGGAHGWLADAPPSVSVVVVVAARRVVRVGRGLGLKALCLWRVRD